MAFSRSLFDRATAHFRPHLDSRRIEDSHVFSKRQKAAVGEEEGNVQMLCGALIGIKSPCFSLQLFINGLNWGRVLVIFTSNGINPCEDYVNSFFACERNLGFKTSKFYQLCTEAFFEPLNKCEPDIRPLSLIR